MEDSLEPSFASGLCAWSCLSMRCLQQSGTSWQETSGRSIGAGFRLPKHIAAGQFHHEETVLALFATGKVSDKIRWLVKILLGWSDMGYSVAEKKK